MRKRTCLAAAGGSLLAATIGLFGAATAASASTASPVTGYTYIDGNTATAARAWARAWLPRARSR